MLRARALALAIVLLAVPLAGCLDQVSQAFGRLQAKPEKPQPYGASVSDFVTPSYSKRVPFPVMAGAVQAKVAIALAVESPLPIPPPIAPAQLEASLTDPSGAPVGSKVTLNPQTTTGTIVLTDFSKFGDYNLVLTGNGLAGNGQGAQYNATISVTYGP